MRSIYRDFALPNFYFHAATAYDILRHNGLEIGKRDFMRRLEAGVRPVRLRPAASPGAGLTPFNVPGRGQS